MSANLDHIQKSLEDISNKSYSNMVEVKESLKEITQKTDDLNDRLKKIEDKASYLTPKVIIVIGGIIALGVTGSVPPEIWQAVVQKILMCQ